MSDAPTVPLTRPESTYRLQFHAGFTFRDATAIVPYLAELGVTHCYASPYLKAKAGSTHGYDVIDHCSLNPEVGTDAERAAWVEALKRHGMSHILDIVPNHVGVATNDNTWWNDVLEHGPASRFAGYFDITWNASCRPELHDKLLLPVLGKPYGEALEAGELKPGSDERGLFVAYYDRRFPICPDTLPTGVGPHDIVAGLSGTPGDPASFDALDELLGRQFYRLAYWRVAPDEINYRRFFDINDLAALRMEVPEVFDATHKLVRQWLADGSVAGLRIDHPDGLYDPRQYLDRLQQIAPKGAGSKPVYVVVEKILAVGEPLPSDWPVDGTSGYDFLNMLNGIFVQRNNEECFSRLYHDWTGDRTSFKDLVYAKKKLILKAALASELHVLAGRLDRLAQKNRHSRDFTETGLRKALREVIACFPVYRSYIAGSTLKQNSPRGGKPAPPVSELDRTYITTAVEEAIRRNPQTEPAVFRFIENTLLLRDASPSGTEADEAERLEFAARFQQLTAPVTAKGIEDTSFYIYNRLVSLNEVGGDPSHFGMPPQAVHDYLKDRQARWPHALSPLSTHDTKRSEDVRARINVLSEMPELWEHALSRWAEVNARHRQKIGGIDAPDSNDEYLLYQTLIGAWPLGSYGNAESGEFTRRIVAYMEKALREAKVHTTWTNPNAAYESAVAGFVARLLDPATGREFLDEFIPFQRRIGRLGMFNSLSQTLLRLAAPGAPDTYQGTELWDFSLVDPDNRRPVDYAGRATMLRTLRARIEAAGSDRRALLKELLETREDGRIKMYVTWLALLSRRAMPGMFSRGDYLPIQATGSRAEHVFGFVRKRGTAVAVVLAPRLPYGLLLDKHAAPVGRAVWQDTAVLLPGLQPGQPLVNTFTGQPLRAAGKGGAASIEVADALADFPVALLTSDAGARVS